MGRVRWLPASSNRQRSTAGESTAATRPADDPVITSTGAGLDRGPRLRVAACPGSGGVAPATLVADVNQEEYSCFWQPSTSCETSILDHPDSPTRSRAGRPDDAPRGARGP